MSQLQELFDLISSTPPNSTNPSIGYKELGFLLRSMGVFMTESEIRDMISEVDTTGSGRMSFSEMCNMFGRGIRKEAESYEEISWAFDGISQGGDLCTITNFRDTFEKPGVEVSEEEVKEMVAEADVEERGGGVCRNDFIAMMETRHKNISE
jgi:calmodulin